MIEAPWFQTTPLKTLPENMSLGLQPRAVELGASKHPEIAQSQHGSIESTVLGPPNPDVRRLMAALRH